MVSLFDIRAARDGSLRDAEPIATAETDTEGRYEINPVPAGAYIVTAEAAGYLRAVKETRIIPDEVRELNFGLRPDIEPTPTPVPEPGSIEGEVVGLNPNGQAEPISDCKVLLFEMGSFDRDNLPAPVAETVSDENGAFAFDNIESGRYIALARHEGYIPGAVPAPVFPGQITSIVIRLMPRIEPTPTPEPRSGDLEGHVTQEGPDGLIPIPSARITAIRMDGAENEMIGTRVVRHAATDENGYYSIEDMFPGRYLVMAQAQGFEPAKAETEIIADEVAVQDFVLAAAEPPVPDTGAIVGRVAKILCITDDVTSCVRVPIEGAGILVMRILDNLEGSSSLLPVGRAVTDANGAYVVDNLPPGMYAVAASKEGFELAIAKARVRSFAETPVNFILLPDGSVDDPLETGVAYDNDFSNDGDGWKTGGAPGYYEMPETRRDGRAIHLRSRDNTNTFGFWNSPRDLLRLRAGIVYKAEFCIATDIEDPALVPTIRIRFNHQSEQQVDLVSLNSRAGAEISPTPEGRVYTHYFTPPSREILLPEDENDIYVSFDLINLAGEDEPEAEVSLVWVKIEAVRAASLERGTLIAATDFAEGPQGWFEQYAEAFSCPEHITGIGALGLRATNNTDNFGGWASPLDLIEIEPDTMYAVVWDIFSDEINTSEMPGVRVRAADTLNRMLVEKGLFSNAEGDQ
ncbi:MAG TPA: carboxypeptidase-like regulatory domain-containing protein, partial [Candidatus Sumerlaeota bacterium]|nr:carboxypeptidase-like regulatory domain-containing protein [Candidatus Sumerlaeota bacterium]